MTSWNPSDNGHAVLSDHDSFINGPPHNTFARMRREDPLARCDGGEFEDYWSLTRYEDIITYNRNFELLSSSRGIRLEDQSYEEYLARRTFQETDPPEHTHMRMLVGKAFSRRVITEYEKTIRELCDEILDQSLPLGEFDAVKEIARQLPMRMLGQIIGVPDDDLDWLVTKGDELIAASDPEYASPLAMDDDSDEYRLLPFRSPAGAELYDYAKRLIKDKAGRNEQSGVLELITRPNAQGEVISDTEFRNFFCLVVAAGNDTTRYALSASLHALANKPELLKQLQQADGDLWDTATEEMIRWASPTMHFRRTAMRDFELHGKNVREGDKVLFWFVSGNRDETQFDNPFEIDLTRKPNRHMAFGQGGPHVCLGMWLARLEVRLLLQALVGRVKSIRQAGKHEFLRSNFVGGIKRLPLFVELNSS
ncbi:MAG: cytochrome P450 [Gammaproteobacteria bacterium]|nr:cytochrome P450 [Gammaproteobacteria bacterium]MYG65171.1 cytochrome P450 [Gammaproteobacteria bacterium]